MEFPPCCSYVGDQGIVEFKLQGSRSGTPKPNLLLFKDAANLFTSQVRSYVNGAYTGTNYTYLWTKISDEPYLLRGFYKSKKSLPKDGNSWHFANAAEIAWTYYLLPTMNEQFAQLGYIEFPLSGSLKAIRIGSGFLEFILEDGIPQRAVVSDMKNITLDSGVFQFTHKDARWWSGKGKYSFTYGNIPNAHLFIFCLKRLTKISW
jgi:hypothetical protein